MNVSIISSLEKFVNDLVANGKYESPRHVAHEALKLLREFVADPELRRESLRRQIAVGIAELDRGEGLDGEKVMAEILKSNADRIAGKQKVLAMNVPIASTFEQFVNDLVANGKYESARQVVHEALILLREFEQDAELRRLRLNRQIAIGIAELDRGEGLDGEKVMAEILRSNADRMANKG